MILFSELHDASSKPWIQLSLFTALVFLLLTQNCSGLPQVVGPSQPVLAMIGDDVVLSCRLEPAVDASGMSIQWSREDLDPSYVYVWKGGVELESSKHRDYEGRTSLLFSELKFGDVSLKLSKVKLSDEGKYRCFIPTLGRGSTVELVVGGVSFPVITLAGLGRTSSSVELQCESAGWYPKPEVLWLDVDGKNLSAGPTETVRGPDDLYTVSSRVTVENKQGNKFTCRVQQNNINQSRETLIHVPDDVFKVQSSKNSTIVGLAAGFTVAFILLILAVVLFVRTRRQKREKKTLVNEMQEELEQEKQENEALKNRLKAVQDEKEKFMKTKGSLIDEKLKWMETERKLKTVIQNKFQELDEMNFDTNSEPTGSDEKNQQEENENQKLMKTFLNLKTELQKMNQELKLKGPLTVEDISKCGFFIRLKNISSEEIKLGGWKLELQKNDSETVIYTFKESLKLQAGRMLYMRRPSQCNKHPDDVDLEWSETMKWRSEDELQIKLISPNDEIFRLL